MLKKIFSFYKNEDIVFGAFIIASFAVISKILGLLRYSLIAARFGTGPVADSFIASFRIPDFIYNTFVLGALSIAIIPVFLGLYHQKKENKDKEAPQDLSVEASEEGLGSVNIDSYKVAGALARDIDDKFNMFRKILRFRKHTLAEPYYELINSILNILLLGLLVLTIVIWIFTPRLINVLMSGFDEARIRLTIDFTRIMLLSPIIFTISNIFGSVLQAFKRFIFFGLAPVVYNIGIIVGIIFFYPIMGANGLAWGVVFGAFLHMMVQIPSVIRLGFRWQPIISWRVPGLKQIARLTVPRALSLSANQLNHLVNTFLASGLVSGSVVIFYNAYDIESIPISLFAVSLAIASFPVLSEFFVKGENDSFRAVLLDVVRKVFFITIPLTFFMILLRAQIVRLILGHGVYNWIDTIRTFKVFGILSFSLIAQSLIPVLSRAFYARENTKTPVIISLFAIGVNIASAVFLVKIYGLLGLAFAFSLASIIHSLLLFLALHKQMKLVTRGFIKSVILYTLGAVFGSAGLYISLYLINSLFGSIVYVWSLLLQAGAAFFIGVFIYIVFLFIFNDLIARQLARKICKLITH